MSIRSGIPSGYGPTRLYAQAPDTSPHPCVDPTDLQELAESEVLKAEWTAGLGRDDSSVVRVTAVGIGTNGGETGLRLFQATHRCDNEDLGSTTAVRDIAGLGELEIYQHPGSDSQPATWTTGFSRNNIFLIVIVQGPATAFDEALFDRLALASHEELHKAVFQEQIAASDVE